MKIILAAAMAIATIGSGAVACPWGGNAYRASGNNGELLLRPNQNCTVLKVSYITSPNEFGTYPMKRKGRNWVASLGNGLAMSFGPKEKTIMLRIGARSERKGFAKVQIK